MKVADAAKRLVQFVSENFAAVNAILVKGSSTGLQFVLTAMVTRSLGAAAAGSYFLFMAVSQLTAVFGRWGQDNTLLRYAGEALGGGDREKAAKALSAAVFIAFVGSVLVGSAIICAKVYLSPAFLRPYPSGLVRTAVLMALVINLLRVATEIPKAAGHVPLGLGIRLSLPPVLFIGFVAIHSLHRADQAIDYQILASLLAASTAVVLARRMLQRPFPKPPWRTISQHRTLGMHLLFVSGVTLIMSWTDTLFVAGLRGQADVGLYGVAVRVANVVGIIQVGVGSVAATAFARQASHPQYIRQELGKFIRLGTILILPFFLTLFILCAPVLSLFGRGFEAAELPLRILLLGQLANGTIGLANFALMMSNRTHILMRNMALAGALNVVGNAILVPFFGIAGAATATASSLLVQAVAGYVAFNTVGPSPAPLS